jgi:hypothetical protein
MSQNGIIIETVVFKKIKETKSGTLIKGVYIIYIMNPLIIVPLFIYSKLHNT